MINSFDPDVVCAAIVRREQNHRVLREAKLCQNERAALALPAVRHASVRASMHARSCVSVCVTLPMLRSSARIIALYTRARRSAMCARASKSAFEHCSGLCTPVSAAAPQRATFHGRGQVGTGCAPRGTSRRHASWAGLAVAQRGLRTSSRCTLHVCTW